MKKALTFNFRNNYNSLNYVLSKNYETVTKFKPLEIIGLEHSEPTFITRKRASKRRAKYLDYNGNEDWTNIWPGARSFDHSISPLPLRQGYIKNSQENNNVKPDKYGNVELMKIPNFLHLTPVHIEKHCNAFKKYCTQWPDNLNDISIKHHFPMEFTQTDYIHSASSIRDIRSRVVTLKLELSKLQLNEREKYKFLKLLGKERYDVKTDMITIVADRCPAHHQNYDYLIYLITALTKESKKFESWELEAGESDWLKYKWEQSPYKVNMKSYLKKAEIKVEEIDDYSQLENKLKSSIEDLYNEKENAKLWDNYKNSVVELLQLKKNSDLKL